MAIMRLRTTAAVVTSLVVGGVGLVLPATGATRGPAPAVYYVGAAQRSIDPTAAMIATKKMYLGGYGLGNGKLLLNTVDSPTGPGRYATGVLNKGKDGYGSSVRAIVVGDGVNAIALAQIETQGYFAAYKQGPYGIHEIRADAAVAALKGKLAKGVPSMKISAGSILVDSNHTHGGADTAGVWGFVPLEYMSLIKKQTIDAVAAAYQAMRPVNLSNGMAHAGVEGMTTLYPATDPLMTNQFSKDPNNQLVDDELRVLQARDVKTGKVVSTYLNFSAHATVLGSENTLMSGDYTGVLSEKMAKRYGGLGFDQEGTLGRSQPARDGCRNPKLKGEAQSICALDSYAERVLKRVDQAVHTLKPLTGKPLVSLHSFLIMDTITSPAMMALSFGGFVAGVPINRAVNPPWFTGNEMGATSFSGRIGDLLISGGPGEMYPQIVKEVAAAVPAKGHFNIGTAGDFLGYIISPVSAYPEPIRKSLFDGEAPPAGNTCSGIPSPVGCPSPVDNDNYFFNVSHTFGMRLTCSLLRGAGETFAGDAMAYWKSNPLCAAFANDLVVPADYDTTFPAQPDLSALPIFKQR